MNSPGHNKLLNPKWIKLPDDLGSAEPFRVRIDIEVITACITDQGDAELAGHLDRE